MENVKIIVGAIDLESGGASYNIERWTIHEKYNDSNSANNIAVLKVRGNIEFNKNVQPIEYSAAKVPPGAVAQVFGWAYTRFRVDVSEFFNHFSLDKFENKN